ncbi:MAG: sigma-70 family RNA polymerase sigma factor [Bacteroidales bacterium]|nr:sigma-70 family RNA polymerase sigma factor [Bacteroidales bacterium]
MTVDISYHTKEEIIKGCIRKDAESQKHLYYSYSDEMYTTAFRILKEEHLAADVLHDAFLLIFRDIKNLKNYDALRSWIKSIVVNTSLKTLKRNRRIHYTDEIPEHILQAEYDPMNGEQLEKAILKLPEGYRVVFLLIEVEGYKHQEVAKMLGISVGTSKSQLFYAKKALRKMLKAYG